MQRLMAITFFLASLGTHVIACRLSAGQDAEAHASSRPEAALRKVLVDVNGEQITEADLEFMMLSRNVPPEARGTARQRFLDQLVDQRLVRAHLASRKTTANPVALESQMAQIKRLIEQSGHEPNQILAKLGYDDQRLQEELSLPLAWQTYVRRVVTKKRLRDYFDAHKAELDGTELRASHIFIKVPTEQESEALTAAEQKLRGIRDEIASGNTTFADAARANSESPSREAGGDVGFIRYRGTMSADFSKVAFSLQSGEISQPFRTRHGVHLCQVTERHDGDYSLEDVRAEVFERLSQEIWDELVRDQRAQARIEWK